MGDTDDLGSVLSDASWSPRWSTLSIESPCLPMDLCINSVLSVGLGWFGASLGQSLSDSLSGGCGGRALGCESGQGQLRSRRGTLWRRGSPPCSVVVVVEVAPVYFWRFPSPLLRLCLAGHDLVPSLWRCRRSRLLSRRDHGVVHVIGLPLCLMRHLPSVPRHSNIRESPLLI